MFQRGRLRLGVTESVTVTCDCLLPVHIWFSEPAMPICFDHLDLLFLYHSHACNWEAVVYYSVSNCLFR